MMQLPSDLAGGTTSSVGFFQAGVEVIAEELSLIGQRGCVKLRSADLRTLIEFLPRRNDSYHSNRRDIIIPLNGWCAVVNNCQRGTDVGGLPMIAAQKYDCRGIRAVATTESEHPAVMLEVYEPRISAPLNRRRLIYAMSDRGRWSFDTEGEPFDFEEVGKYSNRRIRDRFTPDMLERYLSALGVPMLESADESIEGAILVARDE